MAHTYGAMWTKNFSDSPSENLAWKVGLSGLTIRQIRSGLVAVAKSGKLFPPTLPEFIAYCTHSNADFQGIIDTVIYWDYPSELKKRGLEKTSEALYVLKNIDAYAMRTSSKDVAEKIVMKGIDKLKKALAKCEQLPEVPRDFPKVEHKRNTVFNLDLMKEALQTGVSNPIEYDQLKAMRAE